MINEKDFLIKCCDEYFFVVKKNYVYTMLSKNLNRSYVGDPIKKHMINF